MNREYNCKVSSKNSKRLLKNLQKYNRGLLFLPHPVEGGGQAEEEGEEEKKKRRRNSNSNNNNNNNHKNKNKISRRLMVLCVGAHLLRG